MKKGYKEIADILEREIAEGKLPLGSKVPSLRELCRNFSISNVTAARVHKELSARNIVLKIHGSGVEILGPFLPPEPQHPAFPKLKKICFVPNYKSGRPQGSVPLIASIVKNAAEKRGLEFSMCSNDSISLRELGRLQKKPDTATAYVLPHRSASAGGVNMAHILPLIPDIHTVLLDCTMPNSYCVIFDCYGAMDDLVQYVHSRKVRKVLYADRFYSLGSQNASERRYGCEHACRKRGMDFRVIDSARYSDLAEAIRSDDPPDAVMCPQDAVAVRLKRVLDEIGVPERKRPLITGFDGVSIIGGAEGLTTIRFDRKRMAEKAVDVLFNCPLKPIAYQVFRIPGILIKGE